MHYCKGDKSAKEDILLNATSYITQSVTTPIFFGRGRRTFSVPTQRFSYIQQLQHF